MKHTWWPLPKCHIRKLELVASVKSISKLEALFQSSLVLVHTDMDPNTAEENGSHSLSVKKERDYDTKTNDVS